jgi:SAM-dependent methyltransferase
VAPVRSTLDRLPNACAWCAAPLNGTATRLPGRTVCAACGTATTTPWPTDEELARAYAGPYRPSAGRFAGPGDAVLRRLRGRLARRLDRVAPPGPILDVGAGDGALVRALARRGRRVTGLEREARGEHIRDADIAELHGQWAAVVFWHSLEHLRAPGAALDHAARLLAPGGVLVVAVPNAASLQSRAFGDRWLALDLPRHLVHVPAGALLARIRAAGLHVERVSHLRGGQVLFGWLHGLVARLPGAPDLYDAIRRPAARSRPMTPAARAATLAAGALALPVAGALTGLEVAARRGGSVYVEARRGG